MSATDPSGPMPASGDRTHLHRPFGGDTFGRRAEAFARAFGTPRFLLVQTLVVGLWVAINVAAATLRWDPYPFILLNLAFSLQSAYAAPLILLAQTRQADRDKVIAAEDAHHRELADDAATARQDAALAQGERLAQLALDNQRLTAEVRDLTAAVHHHLLGTDPVGDGPAV